MALYVERAMRFVGVQCEHIDSAGRFDSRELLRFAYPPAHKPGLLIRSSVKSPVERYARDNGGFVEPFIDSLQTDVALDKEPGARQQNNR